MYPPALGVNVTGAPVGAGQDGLSETPELEDGPPGAPLEDEPPGTPFEEPEDEPVEPEVAEPELELFASANPSPFEPLSPLPDADPPDPPPVDDELDALGVVPSGEPPSVDAPFEFGTVAGDPPAHDAPSQTTAAVRPYRLVRAQGGVTLFSAWAERRFAGVRIQTAFYSPQSLAD